MAALGLQSELKRLRLNSFHKVPARDYGRAARAFTDSAIAALMHDVCIAVGLIANQFEAVYWSLVGLIHLAALGVLTTHYRGHSAAEAAQPQLAPLALNREEVA